MYLYTQKKLDCGDVILSASFKLFQVFRQIKIPSFWKQEQNQMRNIVTPDTSFILCISV